MSRGPTFWIVVLAVLGAATGLYVEHRRIHPPPPQGVTVADVGSIPGPATWLSLEGRPRPLADWRGKRVLVNFWASWCEPCRREMPMLDATWRRNGHHDVAIVGVAEDTAASVRAFLADRPVGYPIVLADSDAPGGSLSLGNTRRVLPYSVLLGEDGRILRRKIGTFTQAELDDWLTP